MPREKIVIACPTMNSMVNVGLMTFCIDLAKNNDEYEFAVCIVDNAQPVAFARNKIVQLFLANYEADRLFFIDSDTVPPKNTLEMLKVDADIVSGLVPVWKGGPSKNGIEKGERTDGGALYFNSYRFVGEKDKYRPINPQVEATVEDVDACGCAAMVIRRHVLEDERLRRDGKFSDISGAQRELNPDEAPAIFEMKLKPNGEILLGEDMDFCFRAKNLGYSVKSYTGTVFGHLKTVNLAQMITLQHLMYEKGMSHGLKEAVA